MTKARGSLTERASVRLAAGALDGRIVVFMPISIRFSHSTRTPAHMVRFATTIVNGTGFGASEVADVSFDAANVARATTGPTGSFTGTVPTVPERTTPATRWITAGGQHAR